VSHLPPFNHRNAGDLSAHSRAVLNEARAVFDASYGKPDRGAGIEVNLYLTAIYDEEASVPAELAANAGLWFGLDAR
jgi:hypothetical protein